MAKTISHKDMDRYTAALSYLWVLWIYPFFMRRDSVFIQFHAKQGLVLFLFWAVTLIIPPLHVIFVFLYVVAALRAMWGAVNGEEWPVPVVSAIVKKLGM